MDGAVVVQVTQQGKTDWKAEQAHNAQQLDPCKHTCQRYHRVKSNLAADDFGLDDIPDDRYKQIDNKQSQRQGIIMIPPVPRTGRTSNTEIRKAINIEFFTPITVSPRESSTKVIDIIKA